MNLHFSRPLPPLLAAIPLVAASASAQVVGSPLVYVAHPDDDAFSVYTVDPATGVLRAGGIWAPPAGEEGPEGVVPHPSAPFLFVPNRDSANLSVYTVAPATGQLLAGAAVPLGAGPHRATIDADGSHVYVTSSGTSDVRAFAVHPGNGSLSPVGAALATGLEPSAIAVDPAGRFAWVLDRGSRTISVYAVHPQTGALSAGPPATSLAPALPSAIAVAPGGSHVYVTAENFDLLLVYSVDPATGALTLTTQRPTGDRPMAAALHPSGEFLGVAHAGDGSVWIYAISGATGLPSLVSGGAHAVGTSLTDIAFDPGGGFVYVTDDGAKEVRSLAFDDPSGALTPLPPVRTRRGAMSLGAAGGLAPAERRAVCLYALARSDRAVQPFSIDSTDGTPTPLGPPQATGIFPTDVAVDPFGRFLVVLNAGDATLETWLLASGGQLSSSGPAIPLSGAPTSLALDASGRFVFVASAGLDRVFAFTVDATTGSLSASGSLSVPADPGLAALDPTGQFLYVACVGNNAVNTYRFDPLALAHAQQLVVLDQSATAGLGRASSMAFTPDGRRVYVTLPASLDLVVGCDVNPNTGKLAFLPPGNTEADDPIAIVVHPRGRFAYAAVNLDATGFGHLAAFRLDGVQNPGNPIDIASLSAGLSPASVAIDPGGRFLWVASERSDDMTFFALDVDTGLPTAAGTLPAGDRPVALALHTELSAVDSTDCNGNGVPDAIDLAEGTSSDCDGNGTPDECEQPFAVYYCTCAASAPCDNFDPDAGCANRTGSGARLHVCGTASVSADDLLLSASGVPPNVAGLFYMGAQRSVSLFGDGQRCVFAGGIGAGTYRYALRIASPAGVLREPPSVVSTSHARFNAGGRIQAGQTWHFQAWYRDGQGPCGRGFNMSSAASITFGP